MSLAKLQHCPSRQSLPVELRLICSLDPASYRARRAFSMSARCSSASLSSRLRLSSPAGRRLTNSFFLSAFALAIATVSLSMLPCPARDGISQLEEATNDANGWDAYRQHRAEKKRAKSRWLQEDLLVDQWRKRREEAW